ncbi:putative fmn-binding split barrel-related protein [Phaeomoniella chlamydospora]|uniref:Putative fmn-binding split barrel-related protein n=1 Tax=Phaeomoniella chlamydospora TaxID=158046 RepID=A0A0G2F2R2_PHACM|nr:putative fmn-binding split barrel-related protein [Phaeomoniella chlamydospora]
MHPPNLSHLLPYIATFLPLTTCLVLPQSLPDQSPFLIHPQAPPPSSTPFPLPEISSLFAPTANRIPTRYESTVLARRLLALSQTGVLSTVFPSDPSSSSSSSYFPPSVSSLPIGLPDYIADCEEFGDPTILALDIATTFRNAAPETPDTEIRNISLSIDWWASYRELRRRRHHQTPPLFSSPSSSEENLPTPDPSLYSPASLPRLSLLGYLEPISHHSLVSHRVPTCFLEHHPDAAWWLPGNPASVHKGRWLRLRVQQAFWVGGFGDRAYIGWLDANEFKGVKREEWEAVKLPGEK